MSAGYLFSCQVCGRHRPRAKRTIYEQKLHVKRSRRDLLDKPVLERYPRPDEGKGFHVGGLRWGAQAAGLAGRGRGNSVTEMESDPVSQWAAGSDPVDADPAFRT